MRSGRCIALVAVLVAVACRRDIPPPADEVVAPDARPLETDPSARDAAADPPRAPPDAEPPPRPEAGVDLPLAPDLRAPDAVAGRDLAAPPPDAASCVPPFAMCGAACVDVRSSAAHCGGCGRPCATGACVAGQCACGNGMRDGAETDVDCGGGACAVCAASRRCVAARDCAAGLACLSGRCLPAVGLAAWCGLEGTGPAVRDASANANHGTIVGATAVPGKVGMAFQFGEGACVRVPDSPSLSMAGGAGLTIMAWVNHAGTCGDDRGLLVDKELTYEIEIGCASDRFEDAVQLASGATWMWQGAHVVTPRVWQHVALTWDGTVARHYVDGVQVFMHPLVGRLPERATGFGIGCRGVLAGGDGGGRSFFVGAIDEVGVWSRPLSAKEIQDYHAATR